MHIRQSHQLWYKIIVKFHRWGEHKDR
jgi:hypothetical protein